MKYPITINISNQTSQYIAKDGTKSIIARGETLLKLVENLEFMIEQLSPDPDEGLELTAEAKRRFALAKRKIASGKKSTGLTLAEIIKKYGLEDQV